MSDKDEFGQHGKDDVPEVECAELRPDEEAHFERQIETLRKSHSESMQKHAEHPVEPRIGVYICRCGGNISDVV
ncbi:MAG TPA: hypothetical protein VMV98_04865, partial [Acidobacteriaceae bacterium]|nr:hypothetical protein [Acidobacteriaceae bacterium]